MIRTIDPDLRHDAPAPKSDTVAAALYRLLVESEPLGRISAAAREASEAFAAVDEFVPNPCSTQPMPSGEPAKIRQIQT